MPVEDAREETANLNPCEPRPHRFQVLLVTLGGSQGIPQSQDLLARQMGLLFGVLRPRLHMGDPVTQGLDDQSKGPEFLRTC